MPITARLRSQRLEPWGWESRIDLLDDDGKTVLATKVVLDKTQLKEEDYEKTGRFARLIQNYLDDVEERSKEPVKVYTETEVTAILREKGYLTAEEKFSAEMTAKTAEEARP